MSVPVAFEPRPSGAPATPRQLIHDISQPLTALSLVLHLLGTVSDQAERESLLQSAEGECGRAARGVHQLRAALETGNKARRTGQAAALPAEQRPGADA